MTTLVSDIVSDAFRESNIAAITQARSTEEKAEALARLQVIVYNVLGGDVGYVFNDWDVRSATVIRKPNGILLNTTEASAFTAPPNARLVCNLSAALTVALDTNPRDGQRLAVVDAKNNFATYNLTLNPNGRKLQGVTTNTAINTNGTNKQWFYRADLADWKLISALALTDEFVFPSEFDDYFVITLASRINPRYGRELPAPTAARLSSLTAQIVDRYAQTSVKVAAPVAGAAQ